MKMKKIAALSLATVMTLGLSATAFAQTAAPATTDADNAKITIANAAKGETYTIYQLFDATVTGDANGSIAYQLMAGKSADDAGLLTYFDVDASGNVTAKASTTEDTLKSDAFKTWAKEYGKALVEDVESDGSALDFTGLPYGYYFVTTSQGGIVTVDSTNPNATVYDKNETEPIVDPDAKKATNENVSVGDRVTYTVTFKTSNFVGSGETAERIVKYNIADTLPESYLSDVKIESLIIDADGDLTTTKDQTKLTDQADFGTDKNFDIAWVNADNQSLYANGSTVVLTYSALVTDGIEIGQEAQNVNKVTITWETEGGSKESGESSETIYSYALSIQKVDENNDPLPGATFKINGINYVTGTAGHYKVALAGTEGAVAADELACDNNGYLVVEGVAAGQYTVTEVTAPNGYNKLTTTAEVTAQKIGSTTSTTKTEIWKDANGNVIDESEKTETSTKIEIGTNELEAYALTVINQKGSALPSTGGIGTTIFYVVGGVLVVGAGVVLVAKKRMNHEA